MILFRLTLLKFQIWMLNTRIEEIKMFSRNFFMIMTAIFLTGCASDCCRDKECSCPSTGKRVDMFKSDFKQHVDKDSVGYYMESDQYKMNNQMRNFSSK